MVIKLVTMANPCTACMIIDNLLRDLLRRTVEQLAFGGQGLDIDLVIEELHHPRECVGVAGLEVEKLPAILIDDEQITAGSLLHRRQLTQLIETHIREQGLGY